MNRWLIIPLLLLIEGGMSIRYKMIRPAGDLSDENVPQDQWFDQPLDHFDITNPNTWRQRYFVVDEYYQQGGPAFLVISGEWTASGEDLTASAAAAYAKKLNGIVFLLEHRYYGKSHPTSDLSVSNLRFLSSEQALVDTAYFIDGMSSKYELPEGTKWVVFGCSYAANLAAWMREKFPHLVYASVAYSGPVLAKLNFIEFKTSVEEALKKVSQECATNIREAHIQVKQLLTESNQLDELATKFKLCDATDNTIEKDFVSLFDSLAENVVEVVQRGYKKGLTIQKACDIMTNPDVDLVDRYAEFNSLVLQDDGKECMEYKYYKWINLMKDSSWEGKKGAKGDRQWLYQTCSEFGYFQTSYHKSHLFSDDLPLQYYIEQCKDLFGDQFDKNFIQNAVTRTNILYGGLDVKATKVAYVFGSEDPWKPLGITTTRIPESPAIVIEGESHCPCMYGLKETASEELKASYNTVENLVTEWVNE